MVIDRRHLRIAGFLQSRPRSCSLRISKKMRQSLADKVRLLRISPCRPNDSLKGLGVRKENHVHSPIEHWAISRRVREGINMLGLKMIHELRQGKGALVLLGRIVVS